MNRINANLICSLADQIKAEVEAHMKNEGNYVAMTQPRHAILFECLSTLRAVIHRDAQRERDEEEENVGIEMQCQQCQHCREIFPPWEMISSRVLCLWCSLDDQREREQTRGETT